MPLLVQKFGGTSVATIEKIRLVAQKIKNSLQSGNQVIVVVSAMGSYTDDLVALAQQITTSPDRREYDVLLAAGEQITIALLALSLIEIACPAQSFLGFQVPIITNALHSKATIVDIPCENILNALRAHKVAIVAGFQGVNLASNSVTTLGRGGSDTSAVALAAAFKADECQIYTDVDGVYTVDPNIVHNAFKIATVSFQEMLELARLGANVLQMRAVEHASRQNVPLRVLSTFSDNPGTLITHEENMLTTQVVSGIALAKNQARIMISGIPDKPGIAGQILQPLSDFGIDVDMIMQQPNIDSSTNFTFTLQRDDLRQALELVQDIVDKVGFREVSSDHSVAKLSIVGLGLCCHTGIASKMFSALGAAGVNIQLISSSEIRISVLVNEKYLELGARTLAETFDLSAKELI